jgi:hypothetical protein
MSQRESRKSSIAIVLIAALLAPAVAARPQSSSSRSQRTPINPCRSREGDALLVGTDPSDHRAILEPARTPGASLDLPATSASGELLTAGLELLTPRAGLDLLTASGNLEPLTSETQDPAPSRPREVADAQRAEALARDDAELVAKLVGSPVSITMTEDALVAGTYPDGVLEEIGAGLKRSRAWFDRVFSAPPGLELFGGRFAEMYVFEKDDDYFATTAHFASLTKTLPGGWSDAVKNAHGFFFADPYPLSCARVWKRPQDDLIGHCYHHWGHLLASRLEYDGRLLPPWYEEGIAALVEYRSHDRNAVFCRGYVSQSPSTGAPQSSTKNKRDPATKAAPPKPSSEVDPKDIRDGRWKEALKSELGAKKATPFADLVSRQFYELELSDVTAAMGIVEWLESKALLRAFHDELRRSAPPTPTRVLEPAWAREAYYEKAFQAAVKMGWKEADQAWRQWFLTN